METLKARRLFLMFAGPVPSRGQRAPVELPQVGEEVSGTVTKTIAFGALSALLGRFAAWTAFPMCSAS